MVCVKLTLLVISQYMLISAPGPPLKKLTNEIKMETIAKNDDNIQRRGGGGGWQSLNKCSYDFIFNI